MEAGHRCAIHTCRHGDVDVHHIEPWAQRREHRFENLIALCPNCHRRAEAGEIDRPSLCLYKARLAAAFQCDDLNRYPEEKGVLTDVAWVDRSGEWSTRQLTKDEPEIEVSLEYPQFRNRTLGGSAADVNRYVRGVMEGAVDEFVSEIKAFPPRADAAVIYQLYSSFAVTLLRPGIVSLRSSVTCYKGGAHSGHWTEAINLITCPVHRISIGEVFVDAEAGITALSQYAISELMAAVDDGHLGADREAILCGAGPDRKNFSAFNLTRTGILVTFDEYQVASYAAGPSEVHVPYSVVAPLLSQDILREIVDDV